MKAITPDGLKEQLAVIASEKFEGRETSYPGQKLAAHYIASQFQQMGLLPAGDSGTFFQHFPLLHITVDRASRLAATVSGSSTAWTDFGEDYFPSASGRDTVISGEVEFVGYGINSKMLQFTEYDSSKDYRGKIVLVLRGTPDEGDTSSIFHDYPIAGTSGAKRVYAQRSGAAAVLVVEDTKGRTMEDAFKERMDDLTRGAITIPGRARNDIPLFSISRKLADELLTPSGKTIEELQREIDSTKKPDPFSLKDARVTIDLKMRCDSVTSENIVGILPGSDSVLKNEYVVFSAHYDHLGKNVATGEIYYGADDDGSGTCSVIEMAHAFASLAERPKRSLIFLTVSGEEKGLLGSLYYTDHPAIPLSQTVTDLNADMIGRFDPQHEKVNDTNYVYVIGSDKLSMQLDSISKVANEESENLHLDYTFDDESDPHQYYRRSDHYNFARKNVPIIFYFDGEHPDYHKPTDRIEKINFGVYTKRARLIFYTGWKIANAPNRPALDAEKSTSPFSPDR
ncbi:MAG TPA: M28 family peptidase [Bacteroidota bacterium]|nr:M28 family peptidase [Bacteroidota bacterium]